jgi:hypothetical protein
MRQPSHANRPARGERPYDKSKEEAIKAKVVEVRELPRGPRTIVILAVEVEGQQTQIAVGTIEYVKENKMAFKKGDKLIIMGIKGERGADPNFRRRPGSEVRPPPSRASEERLRIRAREITKGKQILAILNSQGRYVWMPEQAAEGE